MSLSNIIGRVLELCPANGAIDVHEAVQTAMPLVMADDEAMRQLLTEALGKRIKDAATSQMRRAADVGVQPSFFGNLMRQAYALDIEGRQIKETSYLTRIEFERIIVIREKQLIADTTQLNVLRRARAALAPLWDMNPEYTYGEVERAFLQAVAA